MASRDFFSDGVERSERPDELRDECARATLALTALFDGEANQTEMSLAQAHLAECARCAWLWQSWARTRFLLRRLPVPEVPPGLLMRVLLAVRLLSVSRLGAATLPSFRLEPKSNEARDARLLAETVLLSGVNPFAPRRARNRNSSPREPRPLDLPPIDPALPSPPADLTRRILQQTVGQAPAKPLGPLEMATAIEPALLLGRRPPWATSKPLSVALMPLVAAWLFVLVRAPQMMSPVTTDASPLASASTPSLTVASPGRALKRLRGFTSLPLRARDADEPLPAMTAMQPRGLETQFQNARRDTQIDEERKANSPDNEPQLVAALSADNRNVTPTAGSATPAIAASMIAASAINAPVVKTESAKSTMTPRISKPVLRAPAISVMPHTLRTRRAEWNAPEASDTDERSVEWENAARHATPPLTTAEPREEDAAPDAAEILDHVARLADSRPDAVRDVVDDFRLSLLSPTEEETPTTSADSLNGQKG